MNRTLILLLIYLFFALITICNCSDNSENYHYRNYSKLVSPEITVNPKTEKLYTKDLLAPSELNIIENHLVVTDRKADKLIKIFDTKSKKLLVSFGTRGLQNLQALREL